MEKGQKGCLLLIAFVTIAAVGIYIAMKLEWLFLKNLMILSPAFAGSFIGERYLGNRKKRTPKWQWALIAALIVLLAGLMTWWMKSR